ncbi:MAG: DUF983 domain-containing protein [Gammaproteobacteria bacterium]
MVSDYPEVSPFKAGLTCRCPRCGIGPLFDGFLTLADRCSACGLDLKSADSGDGPAIFVIFIVGPIVTLLAFWVEAAFEPPYWVHMVLWGPAILLGSLALLRPFKATLIALQYRHRAGDTGTHTFTDDDG